MARCIPWSFLQHAQEASVFGSGGPHFWLLCGATRRWVAGRYGCAAHIASAPNHSPIQVPSCGELALISSVSRPGCVPVSPRNVVATPPQRPSIMRLGGRGRLPTLPVVCVGECPQAMASWPRARASLTYERLARLGLARGGLSRDPLEPWRLPPTLSPPSPCFSTCRRRARWCVEVSRPGAQRLPLRLASHMRCPGRSRALTFSLCYDVLMFSAPRHAHSTSGWAQSALPGRHSMWPTAVAPQNLVSKAKA